MPLTDEQREQFAALLAEAEPSDLGDYVPKSVLKGRLSEKDTARKTLQADYEERLAQLQQEHAAAQAQLKEHEDKNKTAEQLYAEKLEAAEVLAAEQRARAETLYEQRKADALHRELVALFDGSGIKPARTGTAIREAMAELGPEIVDDNGEMSLPAEFKEKFGDWWTKSRTDLHAKTGTEMSSPGAGRPPGDPPPKSVLEGKAPGYQQFAAALEAGGSVSVPLAEE